MIVDKYRVYLYFSLYIFKLIKKSVIIILVIFMLLNIKNLNVEINNKKILNDLNLCVSPGEIHAIMGPNGVGKSTLSKVLLGDSNYNVISGDILFDDNSILKLKTDERARLGIFLAMQYPTEIAGISNQDFLRTALSQRSDKRIGLYDFILKCEKATQELEINKSLIHRDLNYGFSGGEKKKNEVLQIKLLNPKLIILDEIDSGLDVDSLKIVANNIKKYKEDNEGTSIIVITHHPKILEYLNPHYVHIINNGNIIKTGDYNLALEIEKEGYHNYINGTNVINEGYNYE